MGAQFSHPIVGETRSCSALQITLRAVWSRSVTALGGVPFLAIYDPSIINDRLLLGLNKRMGEKSGCQHSMARRRRR